MNARPLPAAVAALSLAGAAVAGYLTWVRYAGGELACATGGCETVQSSPYAEVLGVPVSALGLAGFLVVGATALGGGPAARAVGATVALAALGFSGYLVVVQLAVIGAVCDWCLASDGITTVLAAVASLRLRGGPGLRKSRNRIPPRPGWRRGAAQRR